MTTLAFSPSASTVSSLKAPLWSGTELVPQMDRRPDDGSGNGVWEVLSRRHPFVLQRDEELRRAMKTQAQPVLVVFR